MMMDWIVLLGGLVQWLILTIDVLLIHGFVDMYKEIIISASVFTIMGIVIFVMFYSVEEREIKK